MGCIKSQQTPDYNCIIKVIHVNELHKQSLLKMMLKYAFKFSFNWQLFHLEFEHLTETFSPLQYPFQLTQSAVSDFVTAKVLGDLRSNQMMSRKHLQVGIILPFKDQRSAILSEDNLRN